MGTGQTKWKESLELSKKTLGGVLGAKIARGAKVRPEIHMV
jgi:hypothetical protein